MSSWDEIKTDASKLASKVAQKTGELADIAALRLRQQSLKLKLCEEYEKLGRLTYKAARTTAPHDTDLSDTPDCDCTAELEAIDSLLSQLAELEARINAKK